MQQTHTLGYGDICDFDTHAPKAGRKVGFHPLKKRPGVFYAFLFHRDREIFLLTDVIAAFRRVDEDIVVFCTVMISAVLFHFHQCGFLKFLLVQRTVVQRDFYLCAGG